MLKTILLKIASVNNIVDRDFGFIENCLLPLLRSPIMGKKGKKAKGPQAPGLPLTPREINLDLTLQIETLERELLIKSRIEEELRASTMQLRDKVGQMHADLRQSQKCTFAVSRRRGTAFFDI